MYKLKRNLPESCLKDLFSVVNDICNLCSQSDFRVPGINRVFFYGASSISFSGSVIWKSRPNELRNISKFVYSKRQYVDEKQLTVLVGCVKTA